MSRFLLFFPTDNHRFLFHTNSQKLHEYNTKPKPQGAANRAKYFYKMYRILEIFLVVNLGRLVSVGTAAFTGEMIIPSNSVGNGMISRLYITTDFKDFLLCYLQTIP
jgi:hypothetical protein